MQLIECVPNFSEGRRGEVIQAILAAIGAVKEVHILDCHSDPDHNRSVVTYVGSPHSVGEAAFQGASAAARLIDMRHHIGQHPRIGAADVIPFIPLRSATMADCVHLARQVGKRIGEELQIPVYLYENAAFSAHRYNLADLRKGGYETLKYNIVSDPAFCPDFGPKVLGSAGACAVGARKILIAFNVFLDTDDLGPARSIARRLRQSSGGLPSVKALAFLVQRRAQVSMNLTDYQQTSLAQVMERIYQLALEYGVSIYKSELVGLLPQQALDSSAAAYLKLQDFSADHILDHRINQLERQYIHTSLNDLSLLDQLAGPEPVPASGSAVAFSAAMAAALLSKIARISRDKSKSESRQNFLLSLIHQTDQLVQDFRSMVELDQIAFNDFLTARRLPKSTPDEQNIRNHQIQQSALQTARVPLELCESLVRMMSLAEQLTPMVFKAGLLDVKASIEIAQSVFHISVDNIENNLRNMQDNLEANRLLQRVNTLTVDFHVLNTRIIDKILSLMNKEN